MLAYGLLVIFVVMLLKEAGISSCVFGWANTILCPRTIVISNYLRPGHTWSGGPRESCEVRL